MRDTNLLFSIFPRCCFLLAIPSYHMHINRIYAFRGWGGIVPRVVISNSWVINHDQEIACLQVGGSEEAYLAAKSLFLSMGKNTVFCGGPGNGSVSSHVYTAPKILYLQLSENFHATTWICCRVFDIFRRLLYRQQRSAIIWQWLLVCLVSQNLLPLASLWEFPPVLWQEYSTLPVVAVGVGIVWIHHTL